MSNVVHLAQLEGDAREVATEMVKRWPDVVINDSRRDPNEQAERMAKNCMLERYFILGGGPRAVKGTYVWSRASQLCHDISVNQPSLTTLSALKTAFAQALLTLPTSELRKISKHLAPVTAGAHAFDVQPGGPHDTEVCAYLASEAQRRGGRFLTVEAGLVRRHWQARD